jgi:phosphatidylserine/phosphatidylglycerophosphate/cardiolipin synthase-like enzyme
MDEADTKLIFHRDIYTEVVENALLQAKKTVWIATADLKDIHIKMARGYKPVLSQFETMAKRGVRFRIIHAKIPSAPFRKTLESLPALVKGGLELQICPRSHWKMVIVDGVSAYMGSANFTGAGIGVRSKNRRNHEVGLITSNPELVKQMSEQFDSFWMGELCETCSLKSDCPDPI